MVNHHEKKTRILQNSEVFAQEFFLFQHLQERLKKFVDFLSVIIPQAYMYYMLR